ncbi:substrate-binding domain-containing protein [Noviherbaspirillum sp. ST 5-3]|uniref:substrate-binding domain-containing protein n=2 Tax=Oxalobacteraceae TaxID=75682 RepID=UPI0039172AAE
MGLNNGADCAVDIDVVMTHDRGMSSLVELRNMKQNAYMLYMIFVYYEANMRRIATQYDTNYINMKIEIRPVWMLKKADGVAIALPALLQLLSEIRDEGSISNAARTIGLSYRHAWGLLKEFEAQFGTPLVQKVRGKGTAISPLAEKLIWADKRIAARLSPSLDSLASELERELEALITNHAPALRITASHGFAVDALIKQLAGREVSVDLKYRSSTEAVAALARSECDLAGFHLPLGEFKQAAANPYLKWLDAKQHALIHLAYRTQGLFVAKGNPKKVHAIADLARRDLRFVNRQAGSGTRALLELLLGKYGVSPGEIDGYESAELTHAAVAAYVASGMADVGFGVEAAARHFGLDFLPVARERYFFACNRNSLEQPLLAEALKVICSARFRTIVNELPGYDGRLSGSIGSLGDVA